MFSVLDRRYFGELLLNAVFTFVVITTIALLGIAPVAFFKVPFLDLGLYLSLVRFLLIQALSYLLPLTMLIAVVFVYGRAAADHEVTTLKASGIHPFRLLVPGVLLALIVGAVCLEVEANWGPWALYELRALPATQESVKPAIEYAIADGRKSLTTPDGSFTVSWSSAAILPDGGARLTGVLLEKEPKGAGARTAAAQERDDQRMSIKAKDAIVQFDPAHHEVRITLQDAVMISGPSPGLEMERPWFSFGVDLPVDRSRLKFQTLDELFALRERGAATVEVDGARQPLLRAYARDDVEGRIQERFARAASPLAFLLLGFPLALVFKSGNRMVALLLATLIGLFVYYPTDKLADTLLEQKLVGPMVACWSGNGLISAIGLLLLLFVVRK